MRRTVVVLGAALLLGAGGAAWWPTAGAQPVTVDEIGDQVQTLPRGRLPAFAATEEVARLYRFAVESPDTLTWMPRGGSPSRVTPRREGSAWTSRVT